MCYEFVHPCGSLLTGRLAAWVSAGSYFLVCIGSINYLHCSSAAVSMAAKAFFKKEQIRLHALPADELISVIDFPGMHTLQTFHGSLALLDAVRTQSGRPRYYPENRCK